MLAPAIAPEGEKKMRMNFPKRDELLFRIVCALPNASRIGLAWRICRSRSPRSPCLLARDVSSSSAASLPLKLEERGRPERGAEEVADAVSLELAIAARY